MTRHAPAGRLARTRDLSLLALAALFATAAAPHAAQAQDASVTESLLTTFGLVAPTPPDIDYRERAPLVVPPSTGILPPPRTGDDLAGNPSWPKDHDEELKRQAAAQQGKLGSDFTRYSTSMSSKPLTPSQMAKGHRSPTSPGSRNDKVLFEEKGDNRLSPKGLEFKGWGGVFSSTGEKPLVFEGEPERNALVQPPPGYQTPAPGAAYGTVEKKKEAWSLPNWFDRSQPQAADTN